MAEIKIGADVVGRQARAYTPEDESGHRDLLLYDSSTKNTYNAEGKNVDDLLDDLTKSIEATGTNAAITEDITATLSAPIGDVKNGTKISTGTTLTALAKLMFEQTIYPSYKAPSISLSGTGSTSVEAGTSVTAALTSVFTQNDAGAITSHQILKNNAAVKTGSEATQTYSETIVMDDAVSFVSKCTYAQGALKQDNKKNDYPTGRIPAGTVTSATKTYSSYRSYFQGRLAAGKTAPATSAEVRALTNGGAASQGKTFTISAKAGEQGVVFAYPATLRDVSSVKYVEAGNDESKALFTKSTVSVEGAAGYKGIDYKVYTMTTAQPFAADMTFAVTI